MHISLRREVHIIYMQFSIGIYAILIIVIAATLVALAFIFWKTLRVIKNQREVFKEQTIHFKNKIQKRTRALQEVTHQRIVQADQISKLKDDFIFIATHELRAPTTAIVGNTELLLSDSHVQKLPKKIQAQLKDLETAGNRLQQLIKDLLNIARIESGSLTLFLKPVHLQQVIENVVTEIETSAGKENITITVDDSIGNMDCTHVMGDEKHIKEIFTNLLTNAIKYNKPHGRITLSCASSSQTLAISVTDTGIGLSPEEQKKLFTKFFRVDTSTEGTGLGLWIIKKITEKMHGKITVESAKGEGSTFTVWLPKAEEYSKKEK